MSVETLSGTVRTLPDPDDRPESDLVIFDGDCRFCQAQVRRLARWDGGRRLSFLSLHDPRVADRYPDLSHEELMRQMFVIEPGGRRHGGAEAGRYLSRRLPWLWWLAPALHIPGSMPLWQWLYRQVAARRYRFGRVDSCAGDACAVHFVGQHAPKSGDS